MRHNHNILILSNMDCTTLINKLIGSECEYIPDEIFLVIYSHLDPERKYLLCCALGWSESMFRRSVFELAIFKVIDLNRHHYDAYYNNYHYKAITSRLNNECANKIREDKCANLVDPYNLKQVFLTAIGNDCITDTTVLEFVVSLAYSDNTLGLFRKILEKDILNLLNYPRYTTYLTELNIKFAITTNEQNEIILETENDTMKNLIVFDANMITCDLLNTSTNVRTIAKYEFGVSDDSKKCLTSLSSTESKLHYVRSTTTTSWLRMNRSIEISFVANNSNKIKYIMVKKQGLYLHRDYISVINISQGNIKTIPLICAGELRHAFAIKDNIKLHNLCFNLFKKVTKHKKSNRMINKSKRMTNKTDVSELDTNDLHEISNLVKTFDFDNVNVIRKLYDSNFLVHLETLLYSNSYEFDFSADSSDRNFIIIGNPCDEIWHTQNSLGRWEPNTQMGGWAQQISIVDAGTKTCIKYKHVKRAENKNYSMRNKMVCKLNNKLSKQHHKINKF